MARESCASEAVAAAAVLFAWVRGSAPGLGQRLRGAETRELQASARVAGSWEVAVQARVLGWRTLGCVKEESVRREGLLAVPEGPTASCGMRTRGTEALREDPVSRALSHLGKPLAARLPRKTAWRLGGEIPWS